VKKRWSSFLSLSFSVHALCVVWAVYSLNKKAADTQGYEKTEPLRWVEVQPPKPQATPVEVAPLPKKAPVAARPMTHSGPRTASKETPPPPQRPLIAGLSKESVTADNADGPSYQVGDTLMQASEKTSKAPPAEPPPPSGPPTGTAVGYQPVVKPVPKKRTKPPYPEDLLNMGVEADVVTLININERGLVVDVKLVQKAEEDGFNQAALKAAWQTEFSPATQNGVPVPYSLRFTFQFRIDN
jgi:TonB family protein